MQGYHGCAIGKAKQAAKTEIEKLKVLLDGDHQPVYDKFIMIRNLCYHTSLHNFPAVVVFLHR